ncbi:unnamed protein product [Acanthoscelides obtectus]|uniref:Uncharacterized protein n=1 Tax=Acanthoscelides obtectus TaxID=200917 RepID=A0A9P0LG38_ACAOB|nr:unnamed protein product [Acanthoscelides obtectus]CAK1653294.1 hypothetical protein AOBTE_LOCUS18185 [Acanthoscelides obtectus]
MDSFYDMPRRAPAPTPVEKFLAAPAVPEVSLFCPPDGQGQMNYNAWKMQQVQTGHYTASSKVNISKNFNMNSMESSIILKKQVRFEGPISHPHPVVSSNTKMHKIGKENMDPSDTDHKIHRQPANTFEQIYMANIPNRQLDLSLVDLPKNNFNKTQVANLASRDITLGTVLVEDRNQENKCLSNDKSQATEDDIKKTDKLPKTYQEFLEKQKRVVENKKIGSDNSVTDLYNYKRSPMKIPSPVLEKKYDKYFTSNSEDRPKIVDHIQPHIPDNEPFFKEPAPRRPNSQDYDFNHKLYKTKDEPILSHCKCSHGEQKMCSDQKKNIINSENDQSGQIQISPPSSDEPTNKDLLKIIAQQNEQLLLLQKQVTMLLSREQSNAKSIMAPPNRPQVIGEKIMSSTQTEHFHQHVYTPSKKRGLSKFSIDMMTSFEVAIRPSQNNKNQFSKIQEITESESTSEPVEPSLRLEGPLSVPEDCPSPEPTVNIEMQGYDSSDEDGTPDIGATFYKNLMVS